MVLGKKIKKFGAILVKNVFWGIFGGYCPLCRSGYAYANAVKGLRLVCHCHAI